MAREDVQTCPLSQIPYAGCVVFCTSSHGVAIGGEISCQHTLDVSLQCEYAAPSAHVPYTTLVGFVLGGGGYVVVRRGVYGVVYGVV